MASVKSILVIIGVSGVLVAGLIYFLHSGGQGTSLRATSPDETFNGPLTPEEQRVANPDVENAMNPHARITTNHGTITLELFADQMPVTTGNFIELAQSGFYDNTKFHRVIDGFMIQGGDPNTKGNDVSIYGQGGPESTIQDEFVQAENLTNTRGTVAMANTGQPNSGGSQFFINLADNTGLDFDKQPLSSKHPVFARVIDGMTVVDAIANVETNADDLPVDPVVVQSIEIVEQ